MNTWPGDVKAALRFENNVTDDIGTYTWTNSGSVPFSNTIFYADAYSAGPFTGAQDIETTISDNIKTIDFWAYVPTGSDTGVFYACDDIGVKLYFNGGLVYLSDDTYGQAGGFAVPLDSWFRVQITWDGLYETVYINGSWMCEQQTDAYPTGKQRLGNSPELDDPFGGYLDQLKESVENYQGAEILYIPGLTLLSVSPNTGTANGGTYVALWGLNFIGVTAVLFGGEPATNVIIQPFFNNQLILCVTPAGTTGYADVEVYVDPTHTSTLTNGFLYTAPVVAPVPIEAGSAEMIIEKENYVLSATITASPTRWTQDVYDLIKDGKHIHFDIDTRDFSYVKLYANDTVIIDFGAVKDIKKITVFLYPQKTSYFILDNFWNKSKAKIEYYASGQWNNLTWQSFNEYYGLPPATMVYTSTYDAGTVGIISLFDRVGISASKLRITASGVNIGICEVEACDLIISEPTNIRVNEISSGLGEYQGIRISGTVVDTDYSLYNSVEYRKNAFLKLGFKDQSKYMGLLMVDGNSLDEQNFLTYIELVSIYAKLEESTVNKNADIGTQDYAQVIEWLFSCADIYRDLYNMSVVLAGFNYFPENNNVKDELSAVLESGGDISLLNQDGLLTVKSRTQEVSAAAVITAKDDFWVPQFNLFLYEYLGSNCPNFLDLFAPVFGFSLSETYDNSFSAWRDGWLIDKKNDVFIVGADENHYKLKLTTTPGQPGYWKMRGNIKIVIEGAWIKVLWAGQYIAAAGQGTINVTSRVGPSFSDTVSLDTDSGITRVAYYFYNKITDGDYTRMHVGRIVFNQTTNTLISRNDDLAVIYINILTVFTFDFQVESYSTTGSTVILEAVGICGVYRRSVVFSVATPDAITFLSELLSYTSTIVNPLNIYSLSDSETTPVQVINGVMGSIGGNNIKMFLIPAPAALQILTFNFSASVTYEFYDTFSSNWTNIFLTSDLTLAYLKAVDVDVENGTLQLYPHELKYKKGAKNIDENIIYNKLKISVNKYSVPETAEQIYNDEIPFTIRTEAYVFINQNKALNLSLTTNLYVKVIVGGNTYEPTYTPGIYYNSDIDCDIVFSAYILGCEVSITPRATTFNRDVQIVRITAFPYDNTGKKIDIVNFSDSQKIYGTIEQEINNAKVNSNEQSVLIQKKYERFLSLPAVFLGDGVTCDLNLAVDFAKYILLDDQRMDFLATYKIYEYEITMDIENNDYQITIRGRAQSYDQY